MYCNGAYYEIDESQGYPPDLCMVIERQNPQKQASKSAVLQSLRAAFVSLAAVKREQQRLICGLHAIAAGSGSELETQAEAAARRALKEADDAVGEAQTALTEIERLRTTDLVRVPDEAKIAAIVEQQQREQEAREAAQRAQHEAHQARQQAYYQAHYQG